MFRPPIWVQHLHAHPINLQDMEQLQNQEIIKNAFPEKRSMHPTLHDRPIYKLQSFFSSHPIPPITSADEPLESLETKSIHSV